MQIGLDIKEMEKTRFTDAAPLAACCEPTGKLWQLWKVLYVFEHKTQYLLIHAPFTRIVVFWHIVTYPQWFRRVKFVVIPPCFV